jgi:hypothetical protein
MNTTLEDVLDIIRLPIIGMRPKMEDISRLVARVSFF